MTKQTGNTSKTDRAPNGTFRNGHEKRGGRKRGTPNMISQSLREAIIEAGHQVGSDGQGKDGLRGYA